jgi:hypothetical protein
LSPQRLAAFALVLAATSMLVAAYAVLSRPATSEPAACSCDTAAMQDQLATLMRRVEAAERMAARSAVRRVAEAATEPERLATSDAPPPATDPADAANDDPADPPEPPRATPRFEEFQVTEPGITVTQSEDGALSVRNTNPELVGQIVTVQAVDEDGRTRPLALTVPPVE